MKVKDVSRLSDTEVEKLLDERYLEDVLWPVCEMEKDVEVKSAAILITAHNNIDKSRSWVDMIEQHAQKFIRVFNRVLSMLISDQDPKMMEFLVVCFSTLYTPTIRKLVAPYVSIPVWTGIDPAKLDGIFQEYPFLKKQWNGYHKKFDKSDEETQNVMIFQRSWLLTMVHLQNSNQKFGEAVTKLLVCLLMQIPTRRYTNTLLKNISQELHQDRYTTLLEHYMNLPFDDFNGVPLSYADAYARAAGRIKKYQRWAFQNGMKDLALCNVAAFSNMLDSLADKRRYALPVRYMDIIESQDVNEDVFDFVEQFAPRTSQYLGVCELLYRLYNRQRNVILEHARQHISWVLAETQPTILQKRKRDEDTSVKFKTNNEYAAKIKGEPGVVKIVHPAVGTEHPAMVQVEAAIEGKFQVKPGDVVYLLHTGETMKIRTGIVHEKGKSRLVLNVDPTLFPAHHETHQEFGVIQSMSMVVRDPMPRPAMDGIKQLLSKFENGAEAPEWLTDALIGMSKDTKMEAQFDLVDTVQDEEHAQEIGIIEGVTYQPQESHIRFSKSQIEALIHTMQHHLTVIDAPPSTGKTELVAQLCKLFRHNEDSTTLIVANDHDKVASKISQYIPKFDVYKVDKSPSGSLTQAWQTRAELLNQVEQLAATMGIHGAHGDSCETAEYFFVAHNDKDDELRRQLKVLRPLELLSNEEADKYLLKRAKIVVMDASFRNFENLGYDNLVLFNGLDEVESVTTALSHGTNTNVSRVLCFDNVNAHIKLKQRFGVRNELARLTGGTCDYNPPHNAGFAHNIQVIESDNPVEYAVVLYRYMRLLNYPQDKIAIQADASQHGLIHDMLQDNASLFGYPRVATSCQADYVIASAGVRVTKRILSAATHGLYITTANSPNWQAFSTAKKIPFGNLTVVLNELYGQSTRQASSGGNQDESESVEMQGFAHFLQYVEQMTAQRVEYQTK